MTVKDSSTVNKYANYGVSPEIKKPTLQHCITESESDEEDEESALLMKKTVLSKARSSWWRRGMRDVNSLMDFFGMVRDESAQSLLLDELYEIISLSGPIIGTYLFEMFPEFVSIALVGHMDSPMSGKYMAAAALSMMFKNMVAIYPGFGLSSAMDTLCTQACGANEMQLMGTILQTGCIVLSAVSVITFVLCFFCTEVLIFLGQPKHVAELAGDFTTYLLPGIPFLFLYELLRKVLQAQNVATPMFYVSMVSNILNIGLGYYLVNFTFWGFLGAAVARTVASVTLPCLLLAYLFYEKKCIKSFWHGWHLKNAINGIPIFLSLGIPGMLQIGLEWWAYELLTVVCGWLPDGVTALGANAVAQNVTSITSMIYWGTSIAGNVRIGQALGAGLVVRAKAVSNLVIGVSAIMSIIVGASILAYRSVLPQLFTNDSTIHDLSVSLLCISAVIQLSDALNGAIQGIFRGSGRQALGAKMFFVAYSIIGLPLGCLLCFQLNLGVIGLWLGMLTGGFIVALWGWYEVSKSNWSQLVRNAQTLIEASVAQEVIV